MKKSYVITLKKNCCGCGACKQVCPQNCIKMEYDKEGFWYPYIDESRCVKCDLCKKVCPILHCDANDDMHLDSYIAISNKTNRINSSSGGLFFLFAEQFIQEGGVVFGASFDEKWQVRHVCIKSIDEIEKLMRSKYVQSNTKNTYKQTKELLDIGKKVLYTGTPCQIAGLKSFLGKEYDELVTVDIFCHGVPSPMIWLEYVHIIESKYMSSIKDINFRDKTHGWKNYSFSVSFADGQKEVEKKLDNEYMRMFLTDYILRPSCYDCKYKGLKRKCDITIGDAWGIEKIRPSYDDDKGVSLVIVHNKRGKKLLDTISRNCTLEKINVDDILPPKTGGRALAKIPEQRSLLFYHWIHGKNFCKMINSMYGGKKNYIMGKVTKILFSNTKLK